MSIFVRHHLKLFGGFSANFSRYIDKNTVDLNQNTLTGRLLTYLKNASTDNQLKSNNNDSYDVEQTVRELMNRMSPTTFKVSREKFTRILSLLEDRNLIKSNKDVLKILKLMDVECSLQYKSMEPSELLNVLDLYMNFIPNRITQLKFYDVAIENVFYRREELDRANLMKLIFYIGLMKKSQNSQKMLRNILKLLKTEEINILTCEELCIIANSTFKTSTKISNKLILDKIRNYLNDNLTLMRDPAVFITLIKSIRQNRYYDEDLLASISCTMFFNKTFKFYTFQTYCHLLALYSDNLYYDENLLDFFTTKCISELKNSCGNQTGSSEIRGKDLVRFLWGLSNLNYPLNKVDIKDVIVPKILECIQKSELDLPLIIDTILYLWMLNYKPYELVEFLSKNCMDEIGDKSNTKQRLNQLSTLIFHEDRILFKKINIRPQSENPNFILNEHLKLRPSLKRVYDCIKTLVNSSKIKMRFEMGYQIPTMNILGITGYERNIYKTVNIEILDKFTTLKNTDNKPTGLMQTKLRILDGLEEGLIILKEDEIEHLTEAELEKLITEELNLVC